jgi:ribosomal protein S15P/S13E
MDKSYEKLLKDALAKLWKLDLEAADAIGLNADAAAQSDLDDPEASLKRDRSDPLGLAALAPQPKPSRPRTFTLLVAAVPEFAQALDVMQALWRHLVDANLDHHSTAGRFLAQQGLRDLVPPFRRNRPELPWSIIPSETQQALVRSLYRKFVEYTKREGVKKVEWLYHCRFSQIIGRVTRLEPPGTLTIAKFAEFTVTASNPKTLDMLLRRLNPEKGNQEQWHFIGRVVLYPVKKPTAPVAELVAANKPIPLGMLYQNGEPIDLDRKDTLSAYPFRVRFTVKRYPKRHSMPGRRRKRCSPDRSEMLS